MPRPSTTTAHQLPMPDLRGLRGGFRAFRFEFSAPCTPAQISRLEAVHGPPRPGCQRRYSNVVLSVRAEATAGTGGAWLRLRYDYGGQAYDYRVELLPVASNLGAGAYFHFRCPVSGTPCKTLYWRPEMPAYFAHRKALKIGYAPSRERAESLRRNPARSKRLLAGN